MAEALVRLENLPVGPIGRQGVGWWGAATLIVTETALFGYLFFSYFYTGATAPAGWLLDPAPKLKLALPNTILLLVSSLALWSAERGIKHSRRELALASFSIAFILGAAFVALQWLEWCAKPYELGTSSYASLYFVTTGMHLVHVIAGLFMLVALIWWTTLDYFTPERRLVVAAGALYWYFVSALSVPVFFTFYVTPYLGFAR
jgi:cytochrome c oxidase subunit III